MAELLSAVEKLELDGDTFSMGLRWEKWKRSLNIYLEASGIKDPLRKRATLLHFGGQNLQEIFFNIPGANAECKDDNDVFEIAVKKLNEYFAPKKSKLYERHKFRLLAQETEEKFEKFLIRLRDQAGKCEFANTEDQLIDQIMEKCKSVELRKKILTMGDAVTLDKIVTEAVTLELVNHQLEGYENKIKTEINKIRHIPIKTDAEGKEKQIARKTCSRCGNFRHFSHDAKCPAKDKTCYLCGLKGHFRQYCKTKKRKGDNEKENSSQNKSKNVKRGKQGVRVNNVDEEDNINYVFHIDEDVTAECWIGGIKINMLIDSGCKHNLLTDKSWEYLKGNKVVVLNQIKSSDKTFLPYGSNTPLKVRGSFEADLKINDRKVRTTFYVIDGGTKNLLGKNTAMALDILKINLTTNQVNQKPFSKLKNVLIEIPIDEKINHMEKGNLKECIYNYLMMYNSTPHSVTGKAPSELFFNRLCRDKIPSVIEINNRRDDSDIRDRDRLKKEIGREYSDRKRKAVESEIHEGDEVYVKNMNKTNKLSLEFEPTPYTVQKTNGADTVKKKKNNDTGQELRRNKVHLKKIEGKWTTVNDDSKRIKDDTEQTSNGNETDND